MRGEPKPIWIPCEGSGAEARGLGYCPMCGRLCAVINGDVIVSHMRDDILARIERGDFDA